MNLSEEILFSVFILLSMLKINFLYFDFYDITRYIIILADAETLCCRYGKKVTN